MPPELQIAYYCYRAIEKAVWLGLLGQLLGAFMLIALWWHQDRAWRIIRWYAIGFLVILVLTRYGLWFAYGIVSDSPGQIMRVFLIISGLVGLAIGIRVIIFLYFDRFHNRIYFPDFGPESWNATPPTRAQWFGLIVAALAIWYPFEPNPAVAGMSIFTFGMPTAFGITLPPVLLFLEGIFLAGSRSPEPGPVKLTGLGCIIAALVTEPITIHGIVTVIIAAVLIIIATRRIRVC